MNAFSFLAAVLLSSTQIDAFGNKAGQCTDDIRGMAAGMSGQDNQSLGWKIVTKSNSYTPDKEFEIEIKNDKADAQFKGILLFAKASDGNYAGTWKLPSGDAFSTSNIEEACKKVGKPKGSAVSHANKDKKNSVKFFWKPTPGGAGLVEFRGLIVTNNAETWMRFKPVNVTGPGSPDNIKAASGNGGNTSPTFRYDYMVTSFALVGASILARFL